MQQNQQIDTRAGRIIEAFLLVAVVVVVLFALLQGITRPIEQEDAYDDPLKSLSIPENTV